MSQKRWVALGIAAVLFVISVVSSIQSAVKTTDWGEMIGISSDIKEEVREKGTSPDKIAVLRLDGVIMDGGAGSLLAGSAYDHQRFLKQLEHAGEDPSVKGVVLRVNTPGGGVVESAEIAEKVMELQTEHKKPVYISMASTAASGGYYISAPATKIIAHPSTLTGSIGVIVESFNYSEFAKKHGLDTNTITSGKHKDILSPSRKMTDEERDIMQSIVDDMYEEFVQVIVDGRDMPEKEVKQLADGRVYSGNQAKELQLVDELGSLDDTISILKKDYQLKGAQVVEYKNGPGLGIDQFIGSKVQNMFGSEVDLFELNDLIRQSNAPRPMYLYAK